ncbi:RodZ family helix-turn-helix domain-containing protein [Aggregatibacter sp. Marseille-P9115]|jgi:cytoskeleton protein RodZ|uniref:RodZ domain-containing protein n=1 Tax=Aggregatibacter sp. Marseille-P9115 TaxID=2866570 RepID=UPI001E528954|nr:RodZ family helix-turn-helix domain-containing protein [Aggregatibacter sp. Marseille-P9115]
MNTPKTIQEAQNNAQEITIGDKFRLAREALNLSLESVAQTVALRPSILQDIENNRFIHRSTPATFVRGYVRSYAKFLKIADHEWLNVIDFGDEQKNDLCKNARATNSVNRYSSHNRWVSYFSALVVLVVLGMTVMWWWENYKQSNAERDNLVNSYTQLSAEAPAAVTNVENVSVVTQPISQVENHVVESTTIEPIVEVKPQENVVATPIVATEVAPANVLQSEMSKINGAEQVASMPESATMETTVTSSSTESAVKNPNVSAVATNDNLYIEVIGNCWISVKDKNRKVLAQKEYKQGDVLSFNEEEPYSLIIGAPGNVKIIYKGEAFPLTLDGRVAKFKLPQ